MEDIIKPIFSDVFSDIFGEDDGEIEPSEKIINTWSAGINQWLS